MPVQSVESYQELLMLCQNFPKLSMQEAQFQTACGSFRLNFWIFRVQSQDFNSMPQSKMPMAQQTNRFYLAHQKDGFRHLSSLGVDVSARARIIFQNCLCKHLQTYLQVAKLGSATPSKISQPKLSRHAGWWANKSQCKPMYQSRAWNLSDLWSESSLSTELAPFKFSYLQLIVSLGVPSHRLWFGLCAKSGAKHSCIYLYIHKCRFMVSQKGTQLT